MADCCVNKQLKVTAKVSGESLLTLALLISKLFRPNPYLASFLTSFSTSRMSSFTEIGADASLTLGLWTVTKEIIM